MSTHNIHFHDKIGKIPIPKYFVFLSCQKDFLGTQKQVQIVQAIVYFNPVNRTGYLHSIPQHWEKQDLSPDRIARLILHILFLENSKSVTLILTTCVCVCVCVCVCGGGRGWGG